MAAFLVAAEVAAALNAPLDAFLVRKLGVPGHEELAMGAVASGGLRVLNEDTIRELRIPAEVIDAVEANERRELARRERLYRGSQAPPDVTGKTVILVDDGLATGSTLRAGALALRKGNPARIVGAVPVASRSVCEAMRDVVDEMVCAETPEPFYAVGLWYDDFGQTTDDEVRRLLGRGESRMAAAPAGATRRFAVGRPGSIHTVGNYRPGRSPASRRSGRHRSIAAAPRWGARSSCSARRHTARTSSIAARRDHPAAHRGERLQRGRRRSGLAGRLSRQPLRARRKRGLRRDQRSAGFHRFPPWMWRNADVLDFVRMAT